MSYFQERINPAEGDTVTLECAVDANPPANSIVWSGPNDIAYEGSIYKIDSIQRCAFNPTFKIFKIGILRKFLIKWFIS